MTYLGGHGEMLRVRRRSSYGTLWRAWHRHRARTLVVAGVTLGGAYLAVPAAADRIDRPDQPETGTGGVQPGRLVRNVTVSRSLQRQQDVVLITRLRDGRVLVSVPNRGAVRVVHHAVD